MTDALTKLSPADLDRLAAEVLGLKVLHWNEGPYVAQIEERCPGQMWHPSTSHDQCQLLVDEIVRRGLVANYREALIDLDPSPLIGTIDEILRQFDWLATATPLAKTQAAVSVILNAKGESDGP